MGETDAFFAPGGHLSRAHPSYEQRDGQAEMARAVERTLSDGGFLMVEAGTGTGKTLAYLIPAVLSGRRVIVSTGTRNLQDQIVEQDLPFLRDRLKLPGSVRLMKGRENYLCRLRFEAFEREPLFELLPEREWLPRIRAWSRRTKTGDRAEIAELPDGVRFWRDVNARGDTCLGARCPEYELCWLTRMKREAELAQIVVVNHHLFFADLAVRTAYGGVLPDYDTVVFDEAHLLEEIATLYFGVQVGSSQLEELARETERSTARAGGSPRGGGGAVMLREAAQAFRLRLAETLGEAPGRVRFEPPARGGPDLAPEWDVLQKALDDVRIQGARNAATAEAAEAAERRVDEIRDDLTFILARSERSQVYGYEARGRASFLLSASPIDVSQRIREMLFDRLHAAVLTSATLAVEGQFGFFRDRLGLASADALVVESPFDHRRQAVLYLPAGLPEPRDRHYLPRALEEIRALLAITHGRAFLLFTSYAVLERVHEALAADGDYPLLVQGEGSKVALVASFKGTPNGVLLGTTSFWHGVDVPGEALSLVVIDKLPFDVPTDPLIAARIERIREGGGSPFNEYQLPLAVLELKQGLGRLLRSRSDRGILAVLDPRLTTRRYGKAFLASLPPYPLVRSLEAAQAFFSGSRASSEEPRVS